MNRVTRESFSHLHVNKDVRERETYGDESKKQL